MQTVSNLFELRISKRIGSNYVFLHEDEDYIKALLSAKQGELQLLREYQGRRYKEGLAYVI